jgi:hypothetical protein
MKPLDTPPSEPEPGTLHALRAYLKWEQRGTVRTFLTNYYRGYDAFTETPDVYNNHLTPLCPK